ncbi:hypothetical protein FE257_002077 [Aspergillus nanangensis]|uniref:NAD(P)-binding protein n=1 Tax=Aspergillus nanangensis TaxID=2582783 RepID=A0AAD4GX38_ASPNN|nr:hypothetical protein FE257_002077 [Aspergillus nanangensis]
MDLLNNFDPDMPVKADAFTANTYRDVYPAIDPTRPELSQAGKVVVITGGSRGLGRSGFAASFARANAAAIVLLARSASNLAETETFIRDINPATQLLSIPTDVADEASVGSAFEQIVARFGTPHVLVNSAGIVGPLKRIDEADLASWWEPQEINIRGTFLVTSAFLKATGPTPSAPTTIINLTSGAGHSIPPGMSAYSIGKLAVSKFTAFLGEENPDITSVSLNPGIVPTDMGNSVPFMAPFLKDTAELGGGTAVWVASGDKKFLSGRFVSANWDVEELEKRKEEICRDDLLTICYRGKFGI